MENLEIKVSRKTRMVDLPKQFISVEGENLQSKLVFIFDDEFVNGQARLEYEIKGNKNYVVLDKENNTYTIPVKNVLTKEGQIDMQLVITEGTDEEEIPVFKSNKFYLFCNSSINAVNKAPDGYELWIEQANVKLNEIDNLDIDIENSIITITKKDGSKVVENVRGEKGEKGEPGVIKMMFLASKEDLPEIGSGDTLYFVKVPNPTSTNYYQEYAWVNKGTEEEPNWDYEDLGGAVLNVDLTDYVKKSGDTMTGRLNIMPQKGIKTGLGAGTFFFGEYGRNVLGWDYDLTTGATSPALLIGSEDQKINLALADDLPYINGKKPVEFLTQKDYNDLVTAGAIEESTFYCITEEE